MRLQTSEESVTSTRAVSLPELLVLDSKLRQFPLVLLQRRSPDVTVNDAERGERKYGEAAAGRRDGRVIMFLRRV